MEDITREQLLYMLSISEMSPYMQKTIKEIDRFHDEIGLPYLDIGQEMYTEAVAQYRENVLGMVNTNRS